MYYKFKFDIFWPFFVSTYLGQYLGLPMVCASGITTDIAPKFGKVSNSSKTNLPASDGMLSKLTKSVSPTDKI